MSITEQRVLEIGREKIAAAKSGVPSSGPTPVTCDMCGEPLSGGKDTFGPHWQVLCASCWLAPDERSEGGLTDQLRGGEELKTVVPTGTGNTAPLPDHLNLCPSCKKPAMRVEVNEWDSKTGQPTEGGTLPFCEECGLDFDKGMDNTDVFDFCQRVEAWARQNVRVKP